MSDVLTNQVSSTFIERFCGPRPSDLAVTVQCTEPLYEENTPIRITTTMTTLSTNTYTLNISGTKFDIFKMLLYDGNGELVPKTAGVAASDESGDPLRADFTSERYAGIGNKIPMTITHNLSDYVVVTRPGNYILVCLQKLTFWEDDFAVSDMCSIRVEGRTRSSSGNHESTTMPSGDTELSNSTFRGIELEAHAEKTAFGPGDAVKIKVVMRNVSTDGIELRTSKIAFHDFRPMLFANDGEYLQPKEWQSQKAPNSYMSARTKLYPVGDLEPQAEMEYEITLQDWYSLENTGSYSLIVARRVKHWDDGFPVSNIAKFEILDSETATTESTDTASE